MQQKGLPSALLLNTTTRYEWERSQHPAALNLRQISIIMCHFLHDRSGADVAVSVLHCVLKRAMLRRSKRCLKGAFSSDFVYSDFLSKPIRKRPPRSAAPVSPCVEPVGSVFEGFGTDGAVTATIRVQDDMCNVRPQFVPRQQLSGLSLGWFAESL